MNDVREELQKEAGKAWFDAGGQHTLIIPTGGGKSKIALDIIKVLNPASILVLTNSENLRDRNWKAEFEKFGMLETWENRVTSECYQTMFRKTGTYYELVIADEIDASMSEAYSQYYKYNSWRHILGLTGFCTEEKRVMLNEIAPICFERNIQELQSDGLLNKSEFIFIEYDLDNAKNIKIPMKKGGYFMQSENDLYKYYDSEFSKAVVVKSAVDRQFRLISSSVNEAKAKAADWKFKITATKRKSILNNLDSSISVVHSLLGTIIQNPENKVIIFSANTKQSAKLGIRTYNGSDSSDCLDELNSGTINALAVCKKLNRGTNLVGVNYIIKESFDGSETDFHQSHGRGMRLRPNQVVKYIVLVPYFKASVKTESTSRLGQTVVETRMQRMPTQAQKWAEKMMQSFTNIEGRTIKMLSNYQLPQGHGL